MGFQVKIVGDFCNIRCRYCRNRDFDQGTKSVMSLEILEKLFVFLNSLPQKKVRVNWHGGEPLLAGKNFFNHIVRLEKSYPDKLWSNVVQTNATLIDHEWAEFFANKNFQIGVSIDGGERTHDGDRVSATGKGTYQKAMRGVNILRSHGINPGTICTVTKKMAGSAREVFQELVVAGFQSIAFNVFYNTASEDCGDEYGLSDKEWLVFLIEVFEAWLALNDPLVHVRELDAILAWTTGKSSNNCSFRGKCNQWFAIDPAGDIYPCERFGKTVHFGNIDLLKTFGDLSTEPIFLGWKESIVVLPQKCQTCNFQLLCHNGCTRHRQAEEDGVPLYMYCESRLGLYNYVQCRLNGKEKNHE